ncbi:MAG: hypothetical protein JXA43_02060 [Candidatus Diapherotrites archaeon]|nr:hypothetical protein [Candidatus Diapherotrites archaeon]
MEKNSLIMLFALVGLLAVSLAAYGLYSQGYFTTYERVSADGQAQYNAPAATENTESASQTLVYGASTYDICSFECSHPECTKADCVNQCVSSGTSAEFVCAATFGEAVQFGDIAITINKFEPEYSPGYSAFEVNVENKAPGLIESITNIGIATGQHAILADNLGNVYYPQAVLSSTRYPDGDIYGGSKVTGRIFFEKIPDSVTRMALQLFPKGPDGDVYKYVLRK